MVEISPSVVTKFGRGNGAAGSYLQQVVNDQARQGWEFYRIDDFTIIETAGCGCLGFLLSLLGSASSREIQIHVVTFRAPMSSSLPQAADSPT